MNLLMRAVLVLLGLFVMPFAWLLSKLGLAKPPVAVPPDFLALFTHFKQQDLWAGVTVRQEPLNGVECWASFQFGLDPRRFRVAAVTRSSSEEAAAGVEREAAGAPQYTNVCRNGVYVLACTLNPPDPEFGLRVEQAFMSFGRGA